MSETIGVRQDEGPDDPEHDTPPAAPGGAPPDEWVAVSWLADESGRVAPPRPVSGPTTDTTTLPVVAPPATGPEPVGPAATRPSGRHAFRADQAGVAGPAPTRTGGAPRSADPSGRPSGAALDERSIMRERGDRPTMGWRAGLMRLTAGLINPGPSQAERDHQDLLARIRRPLRGAHRIAVMSIKGGVGKTSVTACLGLALAEHRGDRVLVLDANPDAGTLADRLTSENAITVRDLINNVESVRSLTDVARYTSLAGRLQVLASEQDPAAAEAFDRFEYERVSAVITRFYNIAITDSGTGLVHSAMAGTLNLADTLVIVGTPTVDGASRAAKTLEWLEARGYTNRVRRAVVVLSCDRSSKEVDVPRIREYFESRCRAVVEIPFDPHLAAGGRIDPTLLRRATTEAFLELAAHVADGFGRDPLRPDTD